MDGGSETVETVEGNVYGVMDRAMPIPRFGGESEPAYSLVWFGRIKISPQYLDPAAVPARDECRHLDGTQHFKRVPKVKVSPPKHQKTQSGALNWVFSATSNPLKKLADLGVVVTVESILTSVGSELWVGMS